MKLEQHQAIPMRLSDLPNLRIGQKCLAELRAKLTTALGAADAYARPALEAAAEAVSSAANQADEAVRRTVELESLVAERERESRAALAALTAAQNAEEGFVILDAPLDTKAALKARDTSYLCEIEARRAERRLYAAKLELASVTDPWRTLRQTVDEAKHSNRALAGAVFNGHVEPKPIVDLTKLGLVLAHEADELEAFAAPGGKREQRRIPVSALAGVYRERLAASLAAIASTMKERERDELLKQIRTDVLATPSAVAAVADAIATAES